MMVALFVLSALALIIGTQRMRLWGHNPMGSFNCRRWGILVDVGHPTLNNGDIVVMDGPRLHRIAGVAEVLAEFGATVLYLPAYSPEFNPIEMAWAWCKNKIRALAPRHLSWLKTKLWEKWEAIDAKACSGWIKHSGYTILVPT